MRPHLCHVVFFPSLLWALRWKKRILSQWKCLFNAFPWIELLRIHLWINPRKKGDIFKNQVSFVIDNNAEVLWRISHQSCCSDELSNPPEKGGRTKKTKKSMLLVQVTWFVCEYEYVNLYKDRGRDVLIEYCKNFQRFLATQLPTLDQSEWSMDSHRVQKNSILLIQLVWTSNEITTSLKSFLLPYPIKIFSLYNVAWN